MAILKEQLRVASEKLAEDARQKEIARIAAEKEAEVTILKE